MGGKEGGICQIKTSRYKKGRCQKGGGEDGTSEGGEEGSGKGGKEGCARQESGEDSFGSVPTRYYHLGMKPELIHKLAAALSRPIRTESTVVYITVEIRKLMERLESSKCYPVLRLFCNWAVHIELDKGDALKDLLGAFEEAIESVKSGNDIPLAFRRRLSLSTFRSEFQAFLNATKLPSKVVDDDDRWNEFLTLYSSVVSDCPLAYTKRDHPFSIISNLSLVGAIRDGRQSRLALHEGWSPVGLNWRIELTDGSVENLQFYN